MDLSAILKNQSSLFAFMKFLKEENSLNQLQFCLSVGKPNFFYLNNDNYLKDIKLMTKYYRTHIRHYNL